MREKIKLLPSAGTGYFYWKPNGYLGSGRRFVADLTLFVDTFDG